MRKIHFLLLLVSLGMPTVAIAADMEQQETPTAEQIHRGEDAATIERIMRRYPPTERDVTYGVADGTVLKLDVFAPRNKFDRRRKAVIVIHGGSWRGYDKTLLAAMSNFLQKHGFVVFSINYRYVREGKNTWPAQLDDAQRAVRWVRAHAQQYNIDPDHIGALGHSAGAQMAAMLGEVDTRDNSDHALAQYSSRVQAVVDASGPTDFLAYRQPDGDAILTDLMGAPASKAEPAWKAASPIWNVTPTTCPMLIVHGRKDDQVDYSQSEVFYKLLKHNGVPVKFITTNDGHAYTTLSSKFKWAYGSKAFLRKYLGD